MRGSNWEGGGDLIFFLFFFSSFFYVFMSYGVFAIVAILCVIYNLGWNVSIINVKIYDAIKVMRASRL